MAARLLVAGGTTSTVAQAVGVDRRTVYRWSRDPAFVALIDDETDRLTAEETQARAVAHRAWRDAIDARVRRALGNSTLNLIKRDALM